MNAKAGGKHPGGKRSAALRSPERSASDASSYKTLNSANSASSSSSASFDATWNRGFGERFGLFSVGRSSRVLFNQ